MSVSDSMDKVVTYLASVTKQEFTYKQHLYKPHSLRVSPGIFRGYTCPTKCGGCCAQRFSLDYLPSEQRPYRMTRRFVVISNVGFSIFSDLQEDRVGEHFCRNLNMKNGRCNVHETNPFSCDFELLRFHIAQELNSERPNQFTTRLYGRGWNMMRVDGERGAKCEMLPATDETRADVIRKLKRLKKWCEFFRLRHKVDEIIAWAKSDDITEALML